MFYVQIYSRAGYVDLEARCIKRLKPDLLETYAKMLPRGFIVSFVLLALMDPYIA